MNYTKEMFKDDFPKLKEEHFENMKFRYAIALQDMDPWDGDWGSDRDAFLFTFARVGGVMGGGRQFVFKMNCHQKIKKNEVFVCATNHTGLLHSAVRATGVMTIQKVKRNHKRKDGLDQRIASFLTRKRFKRERPIWDWFNKEMDTLQTKAKLITQELNNNFYYIDFEDSHQSKSEFLFKASSKRIKTNYGIENNCYESDFKLRISPYDSPKYKSYGCVKKIFKNHAYFKDANYPLYKIYHKGNVYLFEKQDFEYIENKAKTKIEKIEIEYVNKWEDQLISLQKKERQIKRWRDRALISIKNDIYKNFQQYA